MKEAYISIDVCSHHMIQWIDCFLVFLFFVQTTRSCENFCRKWGAWNLIMRISKQMGIGWSARCRIAWRLAFVFTFSLFVYELLFVTKQLRRHLLSTLHNFFDLFPHLLQFLYRKKSLCLRCYNILDPLNSKCVT